MVADCRIDHGGQLCFLTGVDRGRVVLRIVWTQSFSRELFVDDGVGGIVRIVTTPRVVSVGAAH